LATKAFTASLLRGNELDAVGHHVGQRHITRYFGCGEAAVGMSRRKLVVIREELIEGLSDFGDFRRIE
jgi:hypothetical protein